MHRQRIGQVLSEMGKLSDIDVNEILTEQLQSRRRFGEIAIAWGLCDTGHVQKAWWSQLSDEIDCVDLAALGIDAQAVACLPREAAMRLCAIPIRAGEEHLIVAITDPSDAAALDEIRRLAARPVKFVRADPAAVQCALATYYPGA